MSLLTTIRRKLLNNFPFRKKNIDPSTAYNLWASTYDQQTDNLIIYLNDIIFNQLLDSVAFEGKVVVDIGCGTGSHWGKILSKNPSELIGFEVSEQMLVKLYEKYPKAKAYISKDNQLRELQNNSCDLIISTLVIGYIKSISDVFGEWDRILKKDGDIIITDFHPAAVEKGATRSFKHEGQEVLIKNYLHTLDKIRTLAKESGWKEIEFTQKKVDERIRFFYEKLNMLHAFENSFGTLLLYGIHFKKS